MPTQTGAELMPTDPKDAASEREVAAERRDVAADRRENQAQGREVAADRRGVAADKREVAADKREVVVDAQEVRAAVSLDRIYGFLKALAWMMVVLAFLLVGNLISQLSQSDNINDLERATDRSEITSQASREAAIEARDELRAAVSASQNPEAVKATQNALAAIARIEYAICSGPCEPVPTDNP